MFNESFSHLSIAPTSRPPPVEAEPSLTPTADTQSPIPALARALANANPAAAAALLQNDMDQERNRVRNLWDNLRQRLVNGRGRNQPPQVPIPVGGPAPARPGGEHAIPDALFSELARAFNLNHPHDEMQADEPFEEQLQRVESGEPLPEEETRPEEAPPGSFERFLIDLQVDLRTALSRGDGESEASTAASREGSATPAIVVDAPPDSELVTPQSQSDPPTDGLVTQPEVPSSSVLDISSNGQQDATVAVNAEETNSASAAPSSESERADSNSVNALNEIIGEANPVSASLLTPPQPAAAQASTIGQGATASIERTNAQRSSISWWRTYRFPPMTLSSRPPNAASPTTTQPASTLGATAIPVPSTTQQESATPSADTSAPSTTASEQAHEHLVVPVIVVGLQSINGSRTRSNAALRNANLVPPQASPRGDNDAPPATPTTAQQEGWRSRAARAFGGIGRRSASADPLEPRRETAADNGSRTFFIYVFGGQLNSSAYICFSPNTIYERILSSESSHGDWVRKLRFLRSSLVCHLQWLHLISCQAYSCTGSWRNY